MRRRLAMIATTGAVGLLLAACGATHPSASQTWVPSPAGGSIEGPGGRLTPILPIPSPTAPQTPAGGGSPEPGSPSPSTTAPNQTDPAVVATRLAAPVGLTLLPDGSALVGERTTGRIVHVQPQAGKPVPTVRTITGLDTAGDGGLLDLAISPTYGEDSLIYAYITTPTDNRVVDFTLKGPVTPVLTGIAKGPTDNTGRIMFGADGDLYVGTGDAGHPALAADPASRAGKVLRVNDIGDPAPQNPTASSPVWTSGHRDIDGLCTGPTGTAVFDVEDGATGGPGEVNSLVAGGSYGWPTATGAQRAPAATLPVADGGPGGCAVLGGRLWVTSLDGRALLSTPLSGAGTITSGKFTATLVGKYGRLRTVVAGSDGSLWLTTSNRDGHGRPVAADERVIHYLPSGGGGSDSPL
jgi:glucose/arabinose dehydrogenase